MDNHEPEEDRQLIEFLRHEGLERSPVPPSLQAAVERRIDKEFGARRTIGWGSTLLISAAATVVLGLATPGRLSLAFGALLAGASVIYGLGVRMLTGTGGSRQEASA